jgi:nucleotide-binding universal stress UspA family protein
MNPRIDRILVPHDFSPQSEEALAYACFVATRFGASVDVLHVWEPPASLEPWLPGDVDRVLSAHRDQIDRDLGRVIEPHRLEALRVRAKLVADTPVRGILHEAADGHYDLVVMGTHGRTGLPRAFLGSVAEQVVRRAVCPVLTVGPAPSARAHAA